MTQVWCPGQIVRIESVQKDFPGNLEKQVFIRFLGRGSEWYSKVRNIVKRLISSLVNPLHISCLLIK